MKYFRFLWLFAFFAGVALAPAQVELEKPNSPASAPAQSASESSAPATDIAPSPTPASPAMPPPSEPPRADNTIGLLILAVVLAHVCLPLGVIIGLILLLLILKLYRGGIMKILMGLAATGGGARVIKKVLIAVGCLIVLPAGFLGLNWATKIMDARVSGATWFIYGLVVSVLTGFVFFTLMKAIARGLKKRLGGKMGGMMGNMGGFGGMGGMGGMGDLGGLMGGTRDKPRGKKRR